MKNRIYHIPIFVPHRGCPHDCVFCNQRKITGHTSEVSAKDVENIAEEYLSTIKKNESSRVEIAFFGGSFTGIEIEKQTELLSAAQKYLSEGRIDGIRCSTRPDFINEDIVANLKKYGVTCVELGVQSSDEEVLKNSRRGHSFADVKSAANIIDKYGISLGLQMMLGLPGDNFEKSVKTAEDIISLNPECVRIYPTLVLGDTGLCDMYKSGEYTPFTVDETVEILSKIIPMFASKNIDIIRVGLQTTDEINSDTVIGPYHPALKQLALGRMFLNTLLSALGENYEKELVVRCNPSVISDVVGHKRCNALFLKRDFNIILKVEADSNLKQNEIKIFEDTYDIFRKQR